MMSITLKIVLTLVCVGIVAFLEHYARTGWGLSYYGKKFIRVCYCFFGMVALLVIWLS